MLADIIGNNWALVAQVVLLLLTLMGGVLPQACMTPPRKMGM